MKEVNKSANFQFVETAISQMCLSGVLDESSVKSGKSEVGVEDDYKFKPVYKENKLAKLYNAASNKSIKVYSFYSNSINAMLHNLEVDSGVISTDLSTMELYLNNSFSYFIILTDSKLMTASARPDSVPRLFVKVDAGTGSNIMFIKVDRYLGSFNHYINHAGASLGLYF